jgi:hypothetical protein
MIFIIAWFGIGFISGFLYLITRNYTPTEIYIRIVTFFIALVILTLFGAISFILITIYFILGEKNTCNKWKSTIYL